MGVCCDSAETSPLLPPGVIGGKAVPVSIFLWKRPEAGHKHRGNHAKNDLERQRKEVYLAATGVVSIWISDPHPIPPGFKRLIVD